MSCWTKIDGNISVDNISKEGIVKLFNINLSDNIEDADWEYDCFINNLKNFDIIKDKTYFNTLLVIKDYRSAIKNFINDLPKITGSEGGAEYSIGFYEKHFDLWSHINWASDRLYNARKHKFISEIYEEEYNKKKVERVGETSFGDSFNLSYYGSMRDREADRTLDELITIIKEIYKYFIGLDVYIHLSDSWGKDILIYTDYNKKYEKLLKIKTTYTNYVYDESGLIKKREKKTTNKIINLDK